MGDSPALPHGTIVIAGGRGARLGGMDKAAIRIGEMTLLQRTLQVASGTIVVVGPPRSLPLDVHGVQEEPPFGGPAAAVAAGAAALGRLWNVPARRSSDPGTAARAAGDPAAGPTLVAILAVDQPGVTRPTIRRLADAARAAGGAVLSGAGRRHYTASVVRWSDLQRRIAERDSWHGAALGDLLGPVARGDVSAASAEIFDIDTAEDIAQWRTGAAQHRSDSPIDSDPT